jgi:hypothetical protein
MTHKMFLKNAIYSKTFFTIWHQSDRLNRTFASGIRVNNGNIDVMVVNKYLLQIFFSSLTVVWILLQDYEDNLVPYITVIANNFSNYYTQDSDLLRTKHFDGASASLQWSSEIT